MQSIRDPRQRSHRHSHGRAASLPGRCAGHRRAAHRRHGGPRSGDRDPRSAPYPDRRTGAAPPRQRRTNTLQNGELAPVLENAGVQKGIRAHPARDRSLSRRDWNPDGRHRLSLGRARRDAAATKRTDILLEAGIWIIEGLNLEHVAPGDYELICLPLKIVGSDGAPARAILRPR